MDKVRGQANIPFPPFADVDIFFQAPAPLGRNLESGIKMSPRKSLAIGISSRSLFNR